MNNSFSVAPSYRLIRRHSPGCKYKKEGRNYLNCKCWLWVDGMSSSGRVRLPMKTRDLYVAAQRIAELQKGPPEPSKPRKGFREAADAFVASHSDSASSTVRKYKRVLGHMARFLTGRNLTSVEDVSLELIDAYKLDRGTAVHTWCKELQLFRQFFGFCQNRKWIETNPAQLVRMPKNVTSGPREPYTPDEVSSIIAACDRFGRSSYERRRARAMILLMRFYAFRISDVSMLKRSSVSSGYIRLRTLKNGKHVDVELRPEVQIALEALPAPMGAPVACEYYFWTGTSSKESLLKGASRTLAAVFKLSGVEHAHTHRFRHTLATDILVNGGTAEDAANILGSSPAIIRRYYQRWTPAMQSRTSETLRRVHDTKVAQTERATAIC